MKKYTVWIPTCEFQCYTIDAENEEDAKNKLLDEFDSGKRDWSDWEDNFYGDCTMSDWEVEEQ